MKKRNYLVVAIILFIIAGFMVSAMAQEPVEPSSEAVTGAVEPVDSDNGVSIASNIWVFLNSPLGVSVVIAFLSFVMGKIFTAKPKWKKIILKYGPRIMEVVKTVEKQIPDTTDNSGMKKLDQALEYVKKLEPALNKVSENELKKAITAVHAEAESSGNLK